MENQIWIIFSFIQTKKKCCLSEILKKENRNINKICRNNIANSICLDFSTSATLPGLVFDAIKFYYLVISHFQTSTTVCCRKFSLEIDDSKIITSHEVNNNSGHQHSHRYFAQIQTEMGYKDDTILIFIQETFHDSFRLCRVNRKCFSHFSLLCKSSTFLSPLYASSSSSISHISLCEFVENLI